MGGLFSSLNNNTATVFPANANSNNSNGSNSSNVINFNDPPILPDRVSKPYNCLIISHNNRIQCLIKKIYNLIVIRTEQNPNTECNRSEIVTERQLNGTSIRKCEKIRFQNASILRIALWREGNNSEGYIYQCKIELVYDGELSPDEKNSNNPYYVTDINKQSVRNPKKFNPISFSSYQNPRFLGFFGEDIQNLFNTLTANNEYDSLVFYIIRHGRAWHLVKLKHKLSNLSFDPNQHGGGLTQDTRLTQEGINQALNAGRFLQEKVFKSKEKNVKYVFVSDLARTFQTAFFVCSVLSNIIATNTYIVLPCSNETQSNGKRQNNDEISCDNTVSEWTLNRKAINAFYQENFPGCKVVDGFVEPQCIKYEIELGTPTATNKVTGIELNWSYYLKFYDGNMRSGSNSVKCIKSNMFQEAIKILLNSLQPLNISCKALISLNAKHPLYKRDDGIYIASYNMSWYSGSTLAQNPIFGAPYKSFVSEYSWLRYLFNNSYGQWRREVEFNYAAGLADYTINSPIEIKIQTRGPEPASINRRCYFWLNALNNLCEFIKQYKPGFIGLQEINVNSDDDFQDNVKNISMNLDKNVTTETNIIPIKDRVYNTVGTNRIWDELVKINKILGTKYKLLNGIITNRQGLYIGISIIYDETQVGSLTSYKVVDNPKQFGRPLLMALTSNGYLLSSMHGAQPGANELPITDPNYFNKFNTYMRTNNQTFFQEQVKTFCEEKNTTPFQVYLATDLNDRYSTIEQINVIGKVIKYKGEAPITGAPNWDSSKGDPSKIKTETVNSIKCEISTYDGNKDGKMPLTSAFVDVANELNRGDKLFCTDPVSPITIFESKYSLSNILDTKYVTEMKRKYGPDYNPMCRTASDHSLVFLKCGADGFIPTGSKGGRRSRKNIKTRGRFTSHKRLTKNNSKKRLSKNKNKTNKNKTNKK